MIRSPLLPSIPKTQDKYPRTVTRHGATIESLHILQTVGLKDLLRELLSSDLSPMVVMATEDRLPVLDDCDQCELTAFIDSQFFIEKQDYMQHIHVYTVRTYTVHIFIAVK